MRIPHIVRIGALVLATTGFYTYVGQMVPQKEVQPPTDTALSDDMSPADMAKVGRSIMEGKGICLTCHTIGKTGALRFPDLAGVAIRARTRVAGPERRRVLRPDDVRADRVRRAGLPAGDAADEQASVQPHRQGNPLRDRGPPVARRHADGHDADHAPLHRHGAAAPAAGTRPPTTGPGAAP